MHRANLIAITLASLLATATAAALPDDRYKPINVQANKAEQKNTDEITTTVYTGDVVITQGSMKINGERITITSQKGQIQRLVAVGKPARFEQLSSLEKAPIIAHGNTIDYRITRELVVLRDQASIEQDDSLVTGSLINYNITEERVIANGNKGERVNIVIPPNKQTPANSTSGDS